MALAPRRAERLVGVGLGGRREFGTERAEVFATEVDALAGPSAGSKSWDSDEIDEQLTRLALVLAHLEATWRSGWPLDPEISGIQRERSLQEMMAALRPDLVADIQSIVGVGRGHLRSMVEAKPILNPTFSQSGLVGGADADFIINGCLLDLKSTVRPSLESNELRQVITYALLDDVDEFAIREVVLLFVRRPQLITWNLDQLLAIAGANKTRSALSSSLIDALSL